MATPSLVAEALEVLRALSWGHGENATALQQSPLR